jgi:aspartyl/asparaginyl-tRNA synthetase
MFGFESKSEKRERLEKLDYENALGRLKAKKEGKPYFGSRYEDDDRSSEERKLSMENQENRIWWL